jgi:hypothetical protein
MKFSIATSRRYRTGRAPIGRKAQTLSQSIQVIALIILIIALAACTRSQQASSGGGGWSQTGSTTATPTSVGDGGANLKLERSVTYYYPTGTDKQKEVGAIPLKFTETLEGDLLVKGSGKRNGLRRQISRTAALQARLRELRLSTEYF